MSTLETILTIAFNAGSACGSEFPKPQWADKRKQVIPLILRMVDHVDPGDLAKEANALLGALTDKGF